MAVERCSNPALQALSRDATAVKEELAEKRSAYIKVAFGRSPAMPVAWL